MNRRNFLRRPQGGVPLRRGVDGAGRERPASRSGFVGVGGRAQWLIQHEDFAPARIVAITDCWLPRCGEAAKLHPERRQMGEVSGLPAHVREGEARRRLRRDHARTRAC